MGMRKLIAAAVALLLSSCSRPPERAAEKPPSAKSQQKPPSSYTEEFWKTWQDGKAEVSAYQVTRPRGSSTSVVVFALERFSSSRRVRADNHSGRDVFPVMKMNAVREYGPGAGDMLNVFAALEPVNGQPAGSTVKVGYSSWDWVGSVWRQILLTGRRADLSWRSYLSEEADGQSTRVYPDQHGVPEDCLPMCARRISWPILRLGETQTFSVLPSLTTGRIHDDRARVRVKLSLTKERSTTVVPAGAFRTHTFTAAWPEGGAATTWRVEADPPHRIVRWETRAGETASLLGSERLTEPKDGPVSAEVLRRLGLQPQ